MQDCIVAEWWITSNSRSVPYQWSYTVGNPQVICHIQEKQNEGHADTPQRLQSMFKIQFNNSKTLRKKVPLDITRRRGQDAETHRRQKTWPDL